MWLWCNAESLGSNSVFICWQRRCDPQVLVRMGSHDLAVLRGRHLGMVTEKQGHSGYKEVIPKADRKSQVRLSFYSWFLVLVAQWISWTKTKTLPNLRLSIRSCHPWCMPMAVVDVVPAAAAAYLTFLPPSLIVPNIPHTVPLLVPFVRSALSPIPTKTASHTVLRTPLWSKWKWRRHRIEAECRCLGMQILGLCSRSPTLWYPKFVLKLLFLEIGILLLQKLLLMLLLLLLL